MMFRPLLAITLAAVAATPAWAQSADRGKAAFATCAACHGTAPGEKKMGPTLAGVVGRKAGSLPGYAYSPALAQWGKAWTPAQLDAFLTSPAKLVPGTRMPISVPDAARRADIVAYLATLK